MPATTGSVWFARVAFVECVGKKVALSLRDRLAERGEDADWLLWTDRVDEAAAALGFPVAERQGYGLGFTDRSDGDLEAAGRTRVD